MNTVHDKLTLKGRPSIMDVARAAGYSKATVSKALNLPQDRSPVQPATREHILKVARELKYRPSWRAQAFSARRTHTVGLVYSGHLPPVQGIYERMLRHLSRELLKEGYHLLFVPMEGPNQGLDLLVNDRLDGCLLLHAMPAEGLKIFEQRNLPAVAINALTDLPIPHLLFDDEGGAASVCEHLVGLGHRRIELYLGPKVTGHYSIERRREGYCRAMGEAGLSDQVNVVVQPVEAYAEALARPDCRTTAVICYAHFDALYLRHALWHLGVSIPDRLSLATFNDEFPVSIATPPLTAVSLPLERLAVRAVACLTDQIAGEAEGRRAREREEEVLAETLYKRQSTARPGFRTLENQSSDCMGGG